MTDYNIDNVKNDIENLQDQNKYDFQEIKRLDGLINDYGKKVLQAINMNNQINKKIQNEYEKLKKIIIDEYIQAKLSNDIETINSQLDNKVDKSYIKTINSQLDKKANNIYVENIQSQINNLVLNGDGSQNLEVIQARGKYTTLNSRIAENEDNFNSITIKIESKNKYNCNSVNNTICKYLDYKGELEEQAKTTITHFIDVNAGDVIRFIKNPYTSSNYGALYKIDGTFISKIQSSHNLTESDIRIDKWTKTLVTFTIPSDNSVCKIKLNLETSNDNIYNMVTINEEMPTSFDKYISDYKLNAKKIINIDTEIEKNILNNKIAIFNGASICNGITGIDESEPTYGWGWAGRIGTKNNMIWKNYGIAGGTVCSNTYNCTWVSNTNTLDWENNTYYKRIGSSASSTETMYLPIKKNEWDGVRDLYIRGNVRHCESLDIENMYKGYPNADYVILEACLNDGFNSVPKGILSSSYNDTFTTTTYTSAFEYMLQKSISLFPNAKIGVIIPHRPTGNVSEYQEIARKVCEKWSIPYLDLYKESGLCIDNPTQKAIMFVDNTHLSVKGYDFITQKIENWLKNL